MHLSCPLSFTNSSRFQQIQQIGVLPSRGSNWDYLSWTLACYPPGCRYVVATAIPLNHKGHISLMKCLPTHVSGPPPRLRSFSQYSSPLMPQFSAEAMNLFQNKRQNNKMSSQTYPNSDWLYTPLTSQDSSAGAIINNQISLDIALLGLPPILSLILNHKFTTSAVITLQ